VGTVVAVRAVVAVTAIPTALVTGVGRETVAVALLVAAPVGVHVVRQRSVRAPVAVITVAIAAVPRHVVPVAVVTVVTAALEAIVVPVLEAGAPAVGLGLISIIPAPVDVARLRGGGRGSRQRQSHEDGDPRHPVRVHASPPWVPSGSWEPPGTIATDVPIS